MHAYIAWYGSICEWYDSFFAQYCLFLTQNGTVHLKFYSSMFQGLYLDMAIKRHLLQIL